MPEKTLYDQNLGAIAQGGTTSWDVQTKAPSWIPREARIRRVRIVNRSNVEVDLDLVGSVPANTPRKFGSLLSEVLTLKSPDGSVTDGKLKGDITLIWGAELDEARQEAAR